MWPLVVSIWWCSWWGTGPYIAPSPSPQTRSLYSWPHPCSRPAGQAEEAPKPSAWTAALCQGHLNTESGVHDYLDRHCGKSQKPLSLFFKVKFIDYQFNCCNHGYQGSWGKWLCRRGWSLWVGPAARCSHQRWRSRGGGPARPRFSAYRPWRCIATQLDRPAAAERETRNTFNKIIFSNWF